MANTMSDMHTLSYFYVPFVLARMVRSMAIHAKRIRDSRALRIDDIEKGVDPKRSTPFEFGFIRYCGSAVTQRNARSYEQDCRGQREDDGCTGRGQRVIVIFVGRAPCGFDATGICRRRALIPVARRRDLHIGLVCFRAVGIGLGDARVSRFRLVGIRAGG